MKKKLFLLLFAVLGLSGTFAAPVMPIVSTPASSTYYVMSFGRQAAKCIQENGVGVEFTQVSIPNPIANATNAQKWKIVEVSPGSNTYYLVSKNGVCYSYNGAYFAGGAVSDVFTFTPSTNASYLNSWTLLKGTTGLNDSGGAKATLYGTAAAAGNAINFTFVETVIPDNLDNVIAAASTLYAAGKVGENPGNYSSVDRVTFLNAINTAIAVRDASPAKTLAERDAAAVILETAKTAYSATKVQIKLSTDTPYYYYIKGTIGATATALFATNKGIGNQVVSSDIATIDAQLWKVVALGSGIVLVNKLDGSYLDPSAIAGAAVKTTSTLPTVELKTIVTGQDVISGNDLFSITDNSASPSFILKSDNSGALINGATDNLNFQFIALNATQALTDEIAVCETRYTATQAGTNPGMIEVAAKNAFRAAIDAAIPFKTSGTDAEKIAAGLTLYNAKQVLLAAPTAPIKFSTSGVTVWYAIKNPSRNNYMMDNGLGSNVSGVAFAANNDAFLWKIIDLGDGTVNIIGKLSTGHITVPSADSQAIPMSATPQSWSFVLLGYAQFNINGTNAGARQLHMASGTPGSLVAYSGGLGTASTWMLEEVSTITGIKSIISDVDVKVKNKMIVVQGTKSAPKVYTVSGVLVDANKVLCAGIYIVRVDNKSFKVSIN